MHDAARNQRLKDLFSEALELDESGRTALMTRVADEDPVIEYELRSLVEAHSRAHAFLREPDHPRLVPAAMECLETAELAVGDWIDRYEIAELIGTGGFGCVYRARQHEPVARPVAIKIIRAGMASRQVIARFEAERQTLAMMDHPGIAKIHDAGVSRMGQPYFVMEYIEGVPITRFCDDARISIPQRLSVFLDVCAAVQHAHTRGVIHRDLKPGNILVSNRDGMPHPRIIDFGIARAIDERPAESAPITESRMLVGTPEYMSPEQVELGASGIDTRSDVYSLGALLYELLTGVTPFDGMSLRVASISEMQRIVRDVEPPAPSARWASRGDAQDAAEHRGTTNRRLAVLLQGDLDWITLKALGKDREERYNSPADLAEDIHRHLRAVPVLAGPPSVSYRIRKFIERHRVGVAAAALVAVGIFSAGVIATLSMMSARTAAEGKRVAAHNVAAVNQFMREVLAGGIPERQGADVRLAEVLDRAAAVASQRFANHPAQEAEVRDLLGSVYSELSMWSQSREQFRLAMGLWRNLGGSDDPRSIISELHFCGSAINLQQAGQIADRLPVLLDRAQRVLGNDHLITLDVERSLGLVHMLSGRLEQAGSILRDVRARTTAAGDDDRLQIQTLRNLSRLARMKSHFADPVERIAIVAEIEPLAREQVERAVRAYGEHSLVALSSRTQWAQLLADRCDFAGAAEISRGVLDSAAARLGACHFIVQEAAVVMAEAAHRLDDSQTAADLLLRSIECVRRSGDAMMLTVSISDALPILDRGGRWKEGEILARELGEQLAILGGGHDDMLADAKAWSARFISLQGDVDAAAAILEPLITRAAGGRWRSSVHARILLVHGSNLCRMGRFEECEAALQSAADLLDDFRLGTLKVTPDDVLVEFILLYQAWGKPQHALEYEILRQQTLAALSADSR